MAIVSALNTFSYHELAEYAHTHPSLNPMLRLPEQPGEDPGTEDTKDVCYEEPNLSEGFEGVDYRISYDNEEASEEEEA
jgi:hypothetical protein